ncbi:MAG: hypothetical protein ABIP51_08990 [Bacteroidia bacterium]
MKEKLFNEIRHLLSLNNFRITLTYTLIITSALYFTSIEYSNIDFSNPSKLFENYIILKLVAASILVNWIFYRIPRFFLRIYFHVYIRNKFLKWKIELEKKGKFKLLKEVHGVYKALYFFIKNYFYNLGYFTRNDLVLNVEINEKIKEEIINEVLVDCYKWICCMIHLIITLCFIWKFVNIWLILGAVFLIVTNFTTPFIIIPIVMNLEVLNKIRIDLLKDKRLGKEEIKKISDISSGGKN